MNKQYFTALASYNLWADTIAMKWLEQINDEQWCKESTSSFSSIHKTVLHIASAEKIWIDFWENRPNPVYLSGEFNGSKRDLIEVWKDASVGMKSFVEKLPAYRYEERVTFSYPRGGQGQMLFWQTISHIINHSTYHRGQLVTLLRQVGHTNFSSIDLVTYYRIESEGNLR